MPGEAWTWSEEREFVENVINQRFNFLLVLFAFILTAATQANSELQLQVLLWLGVLTVVPVSVTIAAASSALEGIFRELYKDASHPVTQSQPTFPFPRARLLIGYVVPAVCSLTMIAGALFASTGHLWKPSTQLTTCSSLLPPLPGGSLAALGAVRSGR